MGWFTRNKTLADIVAPVPGIIEKLRQFADTSAATAQNYRIEADDVVKAAAVTAKGLADAAASLMEEAQSADAVAQALAAVQLDA